MAGSRYSKVGVNRGLFNEASDLIRRSETQQAIGSALRMGLDAFAANRRQQQEAQSRQAIGTALGLDQRTAGSVSSEDLSRMLADRQRESAIADRMRVDQERQQRFLAGQALQARNWSESDALRARGWTEADAARELANEEKKTLSDRAFEREMEEGRQTGEWDRLRAREGGQNARAIVGELGHTTRSLISDIGSYLASRGKAPVMVKTPSGATVPITDLPSEARARALGYDDQQPLSDAEIEARAYTENFLRSRAKAAGLSDDEVNNLGMSIRFGQIDPDTMVREFGLRERSEGSGLSRGGATAQWRELKDAAGYYMDSGRPDLAAQFEKMAESIYPYTVGRLESGGGDDGFRFPTDEEIEAAKGGR